MDRRMIGSWLNGPSSLAEAQGIDIGYPGRRLGLPESGPGSAAGQGRRLAATFIDWMLAYLIAGGLFGSAVGPGHRLNLITLGVFAAIQVLLIGTVGTGIGGRLLRIRVVRLDGRLPGPVWALARAGLILLAFPAVVWDRDTRGLHDQITGTVVVVMGTKGASKGAPKTRPAARPAKPEPVNAAPVNAAPVNAAPVNAEPVNAEPVKTAPVKIEKATGGAKAPAAKRRPTGKKRPGGRV